MTKPTPAPLVPTPKTKPECPYPHGWHAMTSHERDSWVKGALLAEQLLDTVNSGRDRDIGAGFIAAFLNGHRTLQQATFSAVIFPLIHAGARNHLEGQHDQRNESALKACADASDVLPPGRLPYI